MHWHTGDAEYNAPVNGECWCILLRCRPTTQNYPYSDIGTFYLQERVANIYASSNIWRDNAVHMSRLDTFLCHSLDSAG